MTTMLEKMTRAIWTQLPQDDPSMATSGRIARAALQAIKGEDEYLDRVVSRVALQHGLTRQAP